MLSTLLVFGGISHLWYAARLVGIAHHSFYSVCREYEDKILSLRNFSSVWINGSYNHRTNNIVDHAQGEQHKASMDHMITAVAKAKSIPIVFYSRLVRSLMTLNSQEKARLMKKFDICYVLAREGIAF